MKGRWSLLGAMEVLDGVFGLATAVCVIVGLFSQPETLIVDGVWWILGVVFITLLVCGAVRASR